MTDPEILSLMDSSPQQGHRALFEEYYSYVYSIAVNILRGYGSAEDVEECVADVFIDFWFAPDSFDSSRGSLRSRR